MTTFSWLHFSDLHAGQEGTEERWGPIEEKLHTDLRRLHRRMGGATHGGWDAVFFTGDLAFSGSEGDYKKVDDKLEVLWKVFNELGCNPVLIAIPGNHDAVQDNDNPSADALINMDPTDKRLTSEKFQEPVKTAFAKFQAWYAAWEKRHAPPVSVVLRRSILVAGDLSALFEKDGLRVGVLGLNSAFVHLTPKPLREPMGNLIILTQQKHAVWPTDKEKMPHAAIVLTHHPREWLRESVNFASDIAPQSQFLLHCFGHMHDANATSISEAGAKPVRRAQSASLFGMEKTHDGKLERIHGYSAGAIDWDGSGVPRLRLWPRIGRRPERGEYYLSPDWAHFELDDDEAITEQLTDCIDRFPPLKKARAEERPLVTELLRAALTTDSAPETEVEVESLITLLVGAVARDAAGGELTRRARLAIEHYLLDPDAEGLESLQRYAKKAVLRDVISVSPKFFDRVQAREAAWKRYFQALETHSKPGAALETLCLVQGTAFIAPQHLLAGLLARMDEDWQKVLDVYDRVAEDREHALGKPPEGLASAAFDRLQTAQWICWLIWGPSIPACTCYAWEGVRALQLGYGDENFSLAVFDARSNPGLLDKLSYGLRETRVGAVPVTFTGRLTWAPLLCGDVDAKRMSRRTQKSLFDRASGGIAMLLESAEQTDKANRSYFTSYQWMMFLVGKKPKKEGGPPRLLGNADYPVFPPVTKMDLNDVRGKRLWRNLVPVFVHANLADAEVFKRQRAMLVDNAIALLHSIWLERAELFDEADTSDGIRFFLVAASDHTGCGWRPQFPSAVPLATVLKERLEREKDRAFADVVSVPEFPAGDEAWKRLAGHFSTCGMPLMVSNYYTYVEGNKPAG
jgi:Calcineurin-like phosphoesterase